MFKKMKFHQKMCLKTSTAALSIKYLIYRQLYVQIPALDISIYYQTTLQSLYYQFYIYFLCFSLYFTCYYFLSCDFVCFHASNKIVTFEADL